MTDQAFGTPIEVRVAAELGLDAGNDAPCPESLRDRLFDNWPPGFVSCDLSLSRTLPRFRHHQPNQHQAQGCNAGKSREGGASAKLIADVAREHRAQ